MITLYTDAGEQAWCRPPGARTCCRVRRNESGGAFWENYSSVFLTIRVSHKELLLGVCNELQDSSVDRGH